MGSSIAFFLPSLEGGGAEKCTVTLVKALARRNLEVNLILARAEGPFSQVDMETVRVTDLGSPTIWKAIPSLARVLRQERPSALVSGLEHANVVALLARRLARTDIRVVVVTHTLVSQMLQLRRPQVTRAMRRLIRLLYPTADHVVAVSRAVAADLSEVARLPKESIEVVYNGVDANQIEALSREGVDAECCGPNDAPTVVAVGSLQPYKDHRTLIEAVSLVRRKRRIRLVVLGDGPERVNLKAQVSRLHLEADVLFRGFVRNPYAWINRSAALVLPSLWEGLPTVLVEAMACGVTPVATECAGSAEVLEQGAYGILTPVGDAAAMADAILEALDHPLPAARLHRRVEDFSVNLAADRYTRLIERAV